MRPDIVIFRDGSVSIVADCKYKKIDLDEYKHHDVYQLLAYCTATGVSKGLLIYPRHVAAVDDEVRIRNTDVSLRQVMLDLSLSGPELTMECDRFAGDVFGWAPGVSDPAGVI